MPTRNPVKRGKHFFVALLHLFGWLGAGRSQLRLLALGECAQHGTVCYGLVAPLYDMAWVAAQTLAGHEAVFRPVETSTKLKVTGVDLFSAGDFAEGDNRTALQIAAEALAGEIALRSGDAELAVRHFSTAVELEDGLTYNEPPTWYYPMRQSLGKALLEAERPAEAEAAYREDLQRFPNNGWSLFGLQQSLTAQGKAEQAAVAQAQFEEAWAIADVTLEASRF